MRRVLSSFILVALITSLPTAAQTSRPFSMSTTAIQALPGHTPLYQNVSPSFSLQTMSADADVITLFPEYLGIPFDSFAGTSYLVSNDPWAVKMTALANAAKATRKPIMIQIVLTRDILVAKAVNQNGQVVVQPGWVTGCADLMSPQLSTLGSAYINYARWMARTFAPKYMVIMIEANLYYVHCGGNTASWQKLVEIERRTYDAVKLINPAIIAFPSFKLEDVYGQQPNGFDQAQYAALAPMKRDRLGFATYPYGMKIGGVFANPYQLPQDYLSRVRDRNPSEPRIVITETGWNSDGIAISNEGSCYTNFLYSDLRYQSAFLGLLLYTAYAKNFDHVSWWSDRDLIPSRVMTSCFPTSSPPFPECNGDIWCGAINSWRGTHIGWTPGFAELAFKSFGTLGLRGYDGTPKAESMATWRRFLQLPIATSP